MSAILEDLRAQIKQGRQKAFFGKYSESLDIFKTTLDRIQTLSQQVSDLDLQKTYQQYQIDIQAEVDVINKLYMVVQKGQNIEQQQQQQQIPQMSPGYGNNGNNNGENYQQKSQENRFPFGKRPFAHHQENKMMDVEPNNMQQNQRYQQQQQHQQTPQQQSQQQYNNRDPFDDPWANNNNNNNNINQMYNKQQQNNNRNNNKNIFQGNNDFLRPNLNMGQNLDKDPDVWDPPAPIAKKQSNNRRISQPNKQKPGSKDVGGGGGAGARRDYKKPWAVNAKTPKQEKKKSNIGDDNLEDREKTFLYSVYPDGRGPDTDLIEMLEREVIDKNPSVKFEDIAELETAKDILQEAVLLPIMMPKFFTGIKRPWKGVLLFGPPGTGKTMLAKAVATTGKTTFFNVSASSLASKWRGESEKLVRLLFEMARFYAPTTIFFDEMDALGSKRVEGENEATRRVKSEMLIQMDGCGVSGPEEERKTVMVLAATNHPWELDEALRRRLEKRIIIPLPSEEGRKQLFNLNLRGLTIEEDKIDWEYLVKATDGFSGADIANICREAALFPMRRLLKKQGGFKNIGDIDQLQKDAEIPLTMQDFKESLANSSKSVSNTDLKRFEEWMTEFGSV